MSTSAITNTREYYDLVNPSYISWEFYSQYVDREPPFGAIGDIVDCRTYRRYIPELNRRERAIEAFLRVVDYNTSLVKHLQSHDDLVAEAELMFDALFNLKALPSNRSRWVGGTESVRRHPASIYNCSFLAINRLGAFGDLFELLCLGVGVGYRVFERDINQLPSLVNKTVDIRFKSYNPEKKENRLESTEVEFNAAGTSAYITVGDSREGWRQAIESLLDIVTSKPKVLEIAYNFDSVRPFGERILGFGGKASGYEALQSILREIHKIIAACPEAFLRSIDCMDICCATAKGVIAGSSRRSALICLFDEDDDLCLNAKTDYALLERLGKQYRSQSNNTCCVGSKQYGNFIKLLETDPDGDTVREFLEQVKPDKAFFDKAFQTMRVLGEPAVDHYLLMVYKRYLAARKYRPNDDWHQYVDVSTNPCHEILGTVGIDGYSGGFCNLSVNDLVKFVKAAYTKDTLGNDVLAYYYFDYAECEQIVRLMARTGLRQTEVNIPMKGWNETQRKERLLGVDAVNGFQDAIALLGWSFDDTNSSDLRKKLNYWANDEATKYSAKLGIDRPLLVTCVKPNGNTGAVLGVSNGIHWGWDKYYLRRVRCNSQDAIAQTLLDQGLTAYPENSDNLDLGEELQGTGTQERLDYFTTLDKQTKRRLLNKCNTIVFEFPVKTTADKSANDISAIDQLRNQFLFSIEYTDHLPSVTITVRDYEWEDVVSWVYSHWNEGFITASFFSYFGESYPLLANQSVGAEEYRLALESLLSNSTGVKRLVTDQGVRYSFMLDEELLNKYESAVSFKDEEDLKVDNCTTGCPIK